MKFDLEQAKAFLSDWDHIDEQGNRANRGDVAKDYGFDRSHAYVVAAHCRKMVADATPKKHLSPVPQM